MKFTDFNLHPDLQKGIDEAEYTDCMPVQEQVLSKAFGGNDLYVQSQTGTGKTAAFLIVIFQRMLTEEALFKRKALIMAPTRELAVQIEEEAKMLGKYLPFKTGAFYGGVGYAHQEKLLRDNAQIFVGTPGRVLDLNKSGKMNLMEISFLVLDEADRMFDMGFYPDLRKLIKVVPSSDRRQTMLFSATLNAYVKNLAWEYTKTPFEIEITPEVVTVEEISQILYHVPSEEKFPLLLGVLKREQPESAIVFCNTKKHTEIIAKRLKHNGYKCEFIIGDLPQVKRLKIIDDVKSGKTKMLIATDVAARGLDIESLAMVINYDVPTEAENYVHRIGRTARAGKTGKAITFSSEQDVYELPAIERYIGKKIPSDVAMPEHYEEDKSKGMRIHTDDYSRGDGKKNLPRTTTNKKEKRFTRSHRDTEKKEFLPRIEPSVLSQTTRTRTSSTNTNQKLTDKQKENKGKKFNKQGNAKGQDLSRLSMEERMAHYKKKYAGQPPEQSKKQQHQKPANIKTETKPVIQETKQEAPVKKGLISKFIGIFRK